MIGSHKQVACTRSLLIQRLKRRTVLWAYYARLRTKGVHSGTLTVLLFISPIMIHNKVWRYRMPNQYRC